jgi:calcineurin-like phosphoesterase family protein
LNRVFVIGDTHFGHKKILEFEKEKRPFESIEHHNRSLIINWNMVVKPKDTVWHLGDVAFGEENIHLMSRLNGYKHLVLGNHDQYDLAIYQKYFNRIVASYKLEGYLLTHVPIHPTQFYRFKGNIHGHLHSSKIEDPRYFNASAEQIGLAPILLSEVIKKMGENETPYL